MKNQIIILFLFLYSFSCTATDFTIRVFDKQKEVYDYKLFIKHSNNCFSELVINDFFVEKINNGKSERIELILLYRNVKYTIPFYSIDLSTKLELYIDNRLFNNKTKKKNAINRSKYIFKKVCYVFLDKSHSILIAPRVRFKLNHCNKTE